MMVVNFDPGLVAMLRETRYMKLTATELTDRLPELAIKAKPGHLFDYQRQGAQSR